MNDTNSGDVVTLNDAIDQIKKWADEKDYEKVKQGCEEVLEVESTNEEMKALLETANKALETPEQATHVEATPVVSETPSAPAEPAVPEAPAIPTLKTTPAPEVKKEEPKVDSFALNNEVEAPKKEEKIEMPAPKAVEPLKVEAKDTPKTPAAPASKPKEEKSVSDIFSKPAEDIEKKMPSPTPAEKSTDKAKKAETPKPAKKGSKSMLIAIIAGVVVIVGLGVSIYMGFLNPIFEAILSLVGL